MSPISVRFKTRRNGPLAPTSLIRPRSVTATSASARLCRTAARPISSRSEEHTSELQSLMRISYAVFCLKKKNNNKQRTNQHKSNTKQIYKYNTLYNTNNTKNDNHR